MQKQSITSTAWHLQSTKCPLCEIFRETKKSTKNRDSQMPPKKFSTSFFWDMVHWLTKFCARQMGSADFELFSACSHFEKKCKMEYMKTNSFGLLAVFASETEEEKRCYKRIKITI